MVTQFGLCSIIIIKIKIRGSKIIDENNKSFIENKILFVSIGICAYNEEKNIYNLLESIIEQKNRSVSIGEIIVVSDGSTDRTDEIVNSFNVHRDIKLIRLKERCGKYVAINELLRYAKYQILVLASADIILGEYAIENLCLPFIEEDIIGITAAHPIPKNSENSFMGYMINLQWELRHKMSFLQPKFSELIAFRNNLITNIIPTFVDEEYIAFLVKNKGYALRYTPNSVFYNRGPEKLCEYILQRKRNHIGHIILKKEYNYEAVTLNVSKIIKSLFSDLSTRYKRKCFWLLGVILIEITIRGLARLEILFRKKPYNYKWKIAESTKVPAY